MLSRSAIVPPRHQAVELSSSGAVEPSTVALSNRQAVELPSCQGIEPPSLKLVSRQLGGPTHQQILHKISAYVAAHGTTHQAAHGTHDRQGLPALFGLAAEENFQGKTGQRRSAANFLPAQERQHKKMAAITHGVRGGRRDHQGLPVLPAFI
jgi:hypothetical protein